MYNLDIDLMILTLELDLGVIKMSYHTKNEVSTAAKVIAQKDRHAHTTKPLYLPHTQEVIRCIK